LINVIISQITIFFTELFKSLYKLFMYGRTELYLNNIYQLSLFRVAKQADIETIIIYTNYSTLNNEIELKFIVF